MVDTDQSLIEGRRETIRAALRDVRLPDGGALADSPRLGPIALEADGKLVLTIEIRADEQTAFAAVRAAIEARLRALPFISRMFVALTASAAPTTPTAAGTVAPPILKSVPKPEAKVLANVGAVIAVASGKGGVGKSTTTVNLALALRHLGLKVGILDADVYGPSLPTLLGLSGKPRMAADGRRILPMEAWGIAALSVGNLVDPETAMIWRGPMITAAITQLIAEVDWGVLDVLLLDMPPGTGDAQLAVAQNSPLTGAVIVSTPQDLALIDARRGVSMFRKLNVPIFGVIENMSHFSCPDCGGRHEIFGHGGAEAEAARIGVPFLGAVPLTMALRQSADLGRPLLATDPEGEIGVVMRQIARQLVLDLNQKPTANGVGTHLEGMPR